MLKIARTEALRRIKDLLSAGRVRVTAHYRKRSTERNFDNQDLRAAIKTGRIEEEGEWDEKYQNLKFRIIGSDADGHPFKVVVGLSSDVLCLITGMRKERGRWQSD